MKLVALCLVASLAGCSDARTLSPSGEHLAEAHRPTKRKTRDDRTSTERAMKPVLAPIESALCVTTGAAALGGVVEAPAMRAVAKHTDGEAAAVTFTYRGETANKKSLASGEVRRQLGLKLRAENGCNLIYVMWRLDPKPMVYAQLKRNPGAKDHEACGASGYRKLRAAETTPPPPLVPDRRYTLRAEIDEHDELRVYIDDTLHWRGPLPAAVRDLRGPAGLRSDNLAFDLERFEAVPTDATAGNAKCLSEDHD